MDLTPDINRLSPSGATLDRPHTVRVAGGVLHSAMSGGLAILGPWTPDGAAGCARCAGLWRADVEGELAPAPPAPDHLLPLWGDVFSALATATDPADLRLHLLALDCRTGEVTRHGFVPHPSCGHCFPDSQGLSVEEPGDTLELTAPLPVVGDTLRTRAMDRDDLRDRLLDFRFGPVAHVYRDEESPLALMTCETVAPGHASREGGYGRSTRFTASEVPAFLEGVERVTGGRRLTGAATVHGSYADVAEDAVDPAALGLHEPEWYGHPSFAPVPYTPRTPTTWVWGWSTRERRRVLVPEHVAYWHAGRAEERFLYESSNGCAVGGTLAEAVLYGLFEVVERDAFLLAWYSRTRLRLIEGADDPDLAHLTDLLTERGLTLRLFDLTSDLGIPTVLATVTAPEEAVRAGRAPALSLATGTHLDPRRALMAAVEETATNALMYPKWVRMRPSVSVERCRPMLDDPTLVRTLEDHTGLHGLWEARPMWEFLEHPSGEVALDRLTEGRPPSFAGTDLASVLRARLAAVHGLGLDVVVVDQSSAPYTAATGTRAVKVIVPGALPMTFGHTHRRTRSLERLTRASALFEGGVPWEAPGRTYPDPHPFP
ncbi:TOMM precursor leader peptide-binding protein [Nocardiopsis sp. L17-MgMaSL7]|uniref:TOMM precursor leader peptide-binding protein n=1 Tax=Nocardiopsis sp. L17-MgMaSL7 TaxID=1938893 RepID=UPI000D70E7F8|nr:TOMM precursor leader peptide-binding protein [Nocardiopsis sp. L17-MgMaSL7]PWV44321.1 ribosomal protein S12 methylthiotransferase accessory factor [Nocardiopsis sp. L17-MgMaSL7]